MKYLKLIIAVLVLMAAATGSALADRGHFQSQSGHFQTHASHFHGHPGHFRSRVFVGFGFDPFWYPWYYYPYYPPPVVYSSPPVYMEQGQSPVPSTNYWYYCPGSSRYYPYVTECPGGWQQVVPVPPDSR